MNSRSINIVDPNMNDENQSLIAEINSSLSLAAKSDHFLRQNGLFKMISFLETCTSSHECTLLEQNCPFWIRTIFQIFENHPVSLHAKLAQYAFYLIIQISKSLSAELQRHISTSLIEKAIILLISSSDLLAKNSLLCLNELISCYRTPCSQFRSKIENYVYTRLESDSDDMIKWSSICYSKLPYLHKNSNNTDIWYIYFTNMLHNANSLLNELFEDYQPRLGVDSLDKQDSIEIDHSETINTSHKGEIRTFSKFTKDLDNLEFKACLSCLTHLLKPLSERTCINVRPSEVIEFLKRIFLFDFKKLQNNCRINLESNYLDNIMSEMLICAFEFCTEFFSVLNTNLIPQTLIINNILLNIGHSIAENNTSSVLTSYYACLNSWMVSLGTNSAFYKNSFALIENLLKKIRPFEKNAISIESNKYDTSKTRQKQKASVLFNQEKNSLNTFQIINQNKMVTSALDCLRTFLKTFSFNLSYNQFELLTAFTKIKTNTYNNIWIIKIIMFNNNVFKSVCEADNILFNLNN
ncbi:proline- glutamic acid- and leucine-rich 1 isoform X1 [Brachionus plicatilis]|uniref:Proline-glutamic acid-and leucine-rich 1 isoform X1 n=1 Tax=Brachionus plicatilis TaxID=10195 RepID=A0A3M7QAT3_BRAPC|nr:proline- glutamic acid- and leucine-rich 1 isoform X1 [Brachionus plicatilis]